MFPVAVGAGAAEVAVGTGAFAAAGAERLGVNAAAVQVFRHIDEQAVQMIPDAAQLRLIGQRAFAVQHLAGLGAEAQRHKLTGAFGIHGTVDALIIEQQAVHRVGRRGVGLLGQFAAVNALGCRVGQQVLDSRRRSTGKGRLRVAFQRKKV